MILIYSTTKHASGHQEINQITTVLIQRTAANLFQFWAGSWGIIRGGTGGGTGGTCCI